MKSRSSITTSKRLFPSGSGAAVGPVLPGGMGRSHGERSHSLVVGPRQDGRGLVGSTLVVLKDWIEQAFYDFAYAERI